MELLIADGAALLVPWDVAALIAPGTGHHALEMREDGHRQQVGEAHQPARKKRQRRRWREPAFGTSGDLIDHL